jgi:O-antigen ligase
MRQSYGAGRTRDTAPCQTTRMQPKRERFDTGAALAAAGLLIATNGPSIWLTNRIAHNGYDIEAWPFLYPFVFVGVIGIVGLARHQFDRDRLQVLALVAVGVYMAWALLSVTWSVAPPITAIRSLIATGVAAFGVWFGVTLSPLRQLRAVSKAMGVAVLASALLVHFRPLEGGGYWDGERHIFFRGIFANANSLGPVCVIGAVSFVSCGVLAPRWVGRGTWSLMTFLSLWLLWRSGSDTAHAALIVVVLSSLVGLVIWLAYRQGVSAVVLLVGATVVAAIGIVVVVAKFWQLSELLSGDSTFGGRREIWDAALDVIPNRLWQGHGYWAYINGPPPVNPVLLTNGTAHDSVLETLLGLGIIGLVPLIVTTFLTAHQVIRGLQRRLGVISLWRAAVILVVFLENVTESFVVFYSYIWVLLIAASFSSPREAPTTDQAPLAEIEISSSSR